MRTCRTAVYLSVDGASERSTHAHAHVHGSVEMMMKAADLGDGEHEEADGVEVAPPRQFVARLDASD